MGAEHPAAGPELSAHDSSFDLPGRTHLALGALAYAATLMRDRLFKTQPHRCRRRVRMDEVDGEATATWGNGALEVGLPVADELSYIMDLVHHIFERERDTGGSSTEPIINERMTTIVNAGGRLHRRQ